MHWLISIIQFLAAPLMPVMEGLIPALAATAHRSPDGSDCTVAAFAVSTSLIGLFCIFSTCWIHARFRNFKERAKQDIAAADVALYFREALLTGAAEGVVILRNGEQERQYFGEGKALYEACMESPQANRAMRAIDVLTEQGTSFAFSVPAGDGGLTLRGLPVAGRAVIYLHRESQSANLERYREILEALPFPVWFRSAGNAIGWANHSFLSTLGFVSLEDAIAANAALEWSERDLAAKALQSGQPAEGRASVIVSGISRTFSLGLAPLSGTAIAGFALDITESARLESRLQLALDAHEEMVQRIPFAVAVFDCKQKLLSYNAAYAELWDFAGAWLDTCPSYGDILDRLRDQRKIPEQRNFGEWKQAHLQSFASADRRKEEFWHMPNGKSVRIVAQPHLGGGTFALFEDITERLHLESSLNLLIQVQKATLDTLDEGIAIFSTDGRLILHNARFSGMWKLSESELDGQPHFAEIASLCAARIGRDGIWGTVSAGVNSATPERLGEWGKATRADGRVISLALSRLPNGATVVTFTDLTDLEQFHALQNDSSNAAA
jgi:PAS domain-containing protein